MPLATKEISFRDALYSEGSPGRVLNLDPEILYGYLGRLNDNYGKVLIFSTTAGLNLITLKVSEPLKIMDLYYAGMGA
jgi:hypothetical protein